MLERVKKRYEGDLGRISDLCLCQITFNTLLNTIQQKQYAEHIKYIFPETQLNRINSMIDAYNNALDRVSFYKEKMKNIGSLNFADTISISNVSLYKEQKLIWIEKLDHAEDELVKIQLSLTRAVESSMNCIIQEMSSKTCILLEHLPWEQQIILIKRNVLFQSWNDMAKEFYCSESAVRKRHDKAIEEMFNSAARIDFKQAYSVRKKRMIKIHSFK
jgi:DNA-directed RNA polymerase specialized sigma24 family protein